MVVTGKVENMAQFMARLKESHYQIRYSGKLDQLSDKYSPKTTDTMTKELDYIKMLKQQLAAKTASEISSVKLLEEVRPAVSKYQNDLKKAKAKILRQEQAICNLRRAVDKVKGEGDVNNLLAAKFRSNLNTVKTEQTSSKQKFDGLSKRFSVLKVANEGLKEQIGRRHLEIQQLQLNKDEANSELSFLRNSQTVAKNQEADIAYLASQISLIKDDVDDVESFQGTQEKLNDDVKGSITGLTELVRSKITKNRTSIVSLNTAFNSMNEKLMDMRNMMTDMPQASSGIPPAEELSEKQKPDSPNIISANIISKNKAMASLKLELAEKISNLKEEHNQSYKDAFKDTIKTKGKVASLKKQLLELTQSVNSKADDSQLFILETMDDSE